MRRTVPRALVCAFVLMFLLHGPAAQAATRSQLTTQAKNLAFSVSLSKFLKARSNGLRQSDPDLNWSADGCSVPSGTPYKDFFRKPCLRHDFAYRNLGNGVGRSPSLALSSDDATKNRADDTLLNDSINRCEKRASDVSNCRQWAYNYRAGLGIAGSKSYTAFYNRECASGYLCLFDDTGYGDRRLRLTSSASDFNNLDFNDKASSVVNRSSRAWVIYDDSGYSDRNYCVAPGRRVSSLSSTWSFNDKTSSAKKLSRSTCP